jgi:hypothetical protein
MESPEGAPLSLATARISLGPLLSLTVSALIVLDSCKWSPWDLNPEPPHRAKFDKIRPTNAPCVVSFTNNFTFKYFNCHTQDHMPSYQAPFRAIQVTCQAIKRQRHKWRSPQRDVCAQRGVLRRTLTPKGT